MPFALDGNPTASELSDAVNYLLSNFSTGLVSNPVNGHITGPTGELFGYLYKYIAIKYADDSSGSTNFSNIPTNRLYYGTRNSNESAESSNPTDYIWNQVTGGFGTTKFLYYISTGGRQINFQVATSLPDTGWVIDSGASIDLDVVTSGNIPVIAESFLSYFTPSTLQVPRSGSPLAPSFTGIAPVMYATDQGSVVPFSLAQTDSNIDFVNNSWRIGNSSTTGYGDISKTNITIGDPTDAGDYAVWPNPTAMPSSPAYLTVPVRYKSSLGVVTQASISNLQLLFADPGANGLDGPTVDISGFTGFTQNAGGAFTPATATLSAVTTNVTSPSYVWSVTGGTPTSSTASSIVITPNSSATSVGVTLTVSGSNLLSPSSKTISMPVVYDGAVGAAGSNGLMSAFPTIYQWTGSSTPPTRPTTTTTYTWATGSYTAPSGWYTSAPSNTTTGNYLWSITYPLNTVATTVTSVLDWTDVVNPIRAIAYNGTNGTNGSSASVLTLNTTNQSFTYDSFGAALPTSQTITFTAVLQNLVGTPVFTATKYDASGASLGAAALGGSGNVRTLSIADFGVANYCVVTASLSGLGDTITVVKLQDGAVGVNAISGFLTNEAVTVQANSSGVVSSFAQAGGLFKVFNGTTDVSGVLSTYSVVSSTDVTISINSTGTYAITAMAASQASATLRAVYGGVTIDKIYNIVKSLAGTDGSNGTDGTDGTDGFNGAATFVITRVANDSSAPTNAEVYALLGRNPVAGDIVTVSYNNYNNATIYRFITSWVLFNTYITGSLIVQNTITGDKVAANTITATNMAANSITAANAALGDASVETLKIAGNAVTVPAGATNINDVDVASGGTDTTVVSVSLDSGGYPIYVMYSMYSLGAIGGTTGSSFAQVQLYNNGVYVGPESIAISGFTGGGGYSSVCFGTGRGIYFPNPGTGVRTFNLVLMSPSGFTSRCSRTTIFAIGVKR